jgi:predicted nucleic acid-binding protein
VSGLVIDASVALQWYLPEAYSEVSRKLLDTPARLMVPGLFYAEFGNALWKRWRREELDRQEIDLTIQALGRVPFEVFPTRDLSAHAVEIALDHGCTVHDGVYLALAVLEGARMITADRKLCNAIAGSALERFLAPIETAN